ncbi:MAG: DMT family transporter [Streptomyces sp.]|uniref:DMT family transporter n=1 Tax=Streptomyces sp. TaxID=1931 RepID=UPI0025CE7F68|nr:DMT family transporter [Streptomyces sp.]MBW8801705.1 DMT family transporter [Streptomyces sp.]
MPTRLLLPFVLVSFAANSLITRHVVRGGMLDAGLVTSVRFLAGAAALVLLALAFGERPQVRRTHLVPALWLGVYAVCISYGYEHIGAAAGTFVFYATVLVTLVAHDVARRVPVPRTRLVGAAVALAGLGVLASTSVSTVTPLGVLLLAATGAAWGLYTAAGRGVPDPRIASTGNFLVLAAVLLPFTAALATTDVDVTAAGVAWAAVMGAGTTAFAYVAWYACQRSLSATQAGTVQLAIPVLTAAGAVVLLGEQISLQLAVAAVLVALGMWLAQGGGAGTYTARARRKRAATGAATDPPDAPSLT